MPVLHEVAALSGSYRVTCPGTMTATEAADAVRQLEEAGAIPFRSFSHGGGVAIRISGHHRVVVRDVTCGVIIVGPTIGIIPPEGAEPVFRAPAPLC